MFTAHVRDCKKFTPLLVIKNRLSLFGKTLVLCPINKLRIVGWGYAVCWVSLCQLCEWRSLWSARRHRMYNLLELKRFKVRYRLADHTAPKRFIATGSKWYSPIRPPTCFISFLRDTILVTGSYKHIQTSVSDTRYWNISIKNRASSIRLKAIQGYPCDTRAIW